MISLRHVDYSYPGLPVLEDVTLEIGEGEAVALMGPNGCGKTTLLRLLNGLIFPGRGEYVWRGETVTEKKMDDERFAKRFHQQMGFVFQNPDTQLFCSSVEEEVAFGPRQMGLSVGETRRRVEDCLELFGLTALRERAPYHLSGGEKKKVALASVLSMNPRTLILDEPFGGLDEETAQKLEEVLGALNRSGKTLILATHDREAAGRLCSRRICLPPERREETSGGAAEAENREDEQALRRFFGSHSRVGVAFSGGTDSAYLLYAAKAFGCDVRAYYVRSAFQPQFEEDDARRLCGELGVPLEVLGLDVLGEERIRSNPSDRCYHCKRAIFGRILTEAGRDGCPVLLDGTNASDDEGDRPGMRALRELEVLSPLRLCGMTKKRVRELSRKAGLFTWDKPAYACLATRIPSGVDIREEDLHRVERAEAFLASEGFRNFRVRLRGEAALIQLEEGQQEMPAERRKEILSGLSRDFDEVFLDLTGRKPED